MSKYVLAVFSNPVEGRADDYNDWYNNVHLQEVTSVPGFVAAQRFRESIPMVREMPRRYLALYEMDADGPEGVEAAKAALFSTKMEISDALDGPGSIMGVFEAFGPKVETPGRALGTFRLVALAESVVGREREHDEWYGRQHIPDVAGTPGFVSGARYKLHSAIIGDMPTRSLTVYGMEATDVDGAKKALEAIRAANHPKTNDAQPDKTRAAVVEVCSARVTAPKDKALA